MTVAKPLILVDTREPADKRREVIKFLRKKGALCNVQALYCGDYESPSCIVERKEILDYEGSFLDMLKTGSRIDRQMLNLALACEQKNKSLWILIHGDVKLVQRWAPEQFWGSIASISIRYFANVIVIPKDVNWVYVLGSVLMKTAEDKLGVPWNIKYIRTDSRRVGMLSAMLRVSTTTSRNLLKACGNVKNVFNSTEAQLQRVSGIGPVRAKRLYDFLNELYK